MTGNNTKKEAAAMFSFQNLLPPKPMSLDGDLGENWKRFKKTYTLYSTATEVDKKDEETQAAILLHCIGEDAMEIFDTLDLSQTEQKNPAKIIEKFEAYFLPKTNQSVESHKFNTRVQGPAESFDNFLADLRKLSANCDFGSLRDRLVRDRIVSGIREKRVQDRLLRETDLTFNKAVDICRAAEQTESHIKLLSNDTKNLEINEIRSNQTRYSKMGQQKKDYSKTSGGQHNQEAASTSQQGNLMEKGHGKLRYNNQNCSRCGYKHKSNNCPAYGKVCSKCSKLNHFANVCKNTAKKINVIDECESDDEEHDSLDRYVLGSVEVNSVKLHCDWFENIKILDCNKTVRFKLATGAHVNVIPKYIFDYLELKNSLKKVNIKISNYGGEPLQVVGSCDLLIVSNNNKKEMLNFIIIKTDHNAAPILGLQSLQKLELIHRNIDSLVVELDTEKEILNKYSDLFSGIGKIKMKPCNIKLKENYKAVNIPTRRVPFNLLEPLSLSALIHKILMSR